MKRVRYIGTVLPTLTGRVGTLLRTDRKGWAHVSFGPNELDVLCAPVNLEDEWRYSGDVNIECGGMFIKDDGDEDYVNVVEVQPVSDAGGPDNVFYITVGSIYLPTDEAKRKSALDCIGWYEESMSDADKRRCLIDAFRAYHGIEADEEHVLRVGPVDKNFWDGRGWNPEPTKVLRSNVNLRRYVEEEFCN